MRIESLGRKAVFLIPSIKVYNPKYSKTRQSLAKTIHTFLSQVFGGYTCASGNIYGYFQANPEFYSKLQRFYL